MKQTEETRDDQALAIAHRHVSLVAAGMVARFGHHVAAAALFGAAVGVVTVAKDAEAAARWLRELADEVEGDDEGPSVGHA
jgi:hypothetical protein